MKIPTTRNFAAGSSFRCRSGFTLVELLAVISILLVVARLTIPAVLSLNDAGNFTNQIFTVSGTLEEARAFAMAKNTYVFVGIAEVDASSMNAPSQTSGTGQVVMSVVSSRDGTCLTTGSGWTPDSAHLLQVSNAIRIQNVHLMTVSSTSGNLSRPVADAVVGSGSTSALPFAYPLSGTPIYNFSNVIQFSPLGAATLVQTWNPHLIELGVSQTHGSTVVSVQQAKYAAIQVDGVTGAIRTFRP